MSETGWKVAKKVYLEVTIFFLLKVSLLAQKQYFLSFFLPQIKP